MKIRSITYFINPSNQLETKIARAALMARQTREALATAEMEVQTCRIAFTPFSTWLDINHPAQSLQQLHQLNEQTTMAGFDFVSIGPALTDNLPAFELIPEILSSTNLFASGMLTTSRKGLDTRAVKASAQIIHESAAASLDGFTNLRFAALGNVPAGSPFFPSAYASSRGEGFGLAIEGADLAVEIFSSAKSIQEAQKLLIAKINEEAKNLIEICCPFAEKGMEFLGIDFTLAPFPGDGISIGNALESLGLSSLGKAGSVTAASILMSVMQQVKIPRIGFNGLMTPVLEDSFLAKRAAEGTLGIQDLLLYATVCGTGLDTIPLPGNTSVEQLYAILLDIGALSLRLKKPLTARLMPIPGKSIGDATEFDFSYFANSRVMDPDAGALTGLLAMDGIIPISPRS